MGYAGKNKKNFAGSNSPPGLCAKRLDAIVLAAPIAFEQRAAEPRPIRHPGDERIEGAPGASTAHDFSSSASARRNRPAAPLRPSGRSSPANLTLTIRELSCNARLLGTSHHSAFLAGLSRTYSEQMPINDYKSNAYG